MGCCCKGTCKCGAAGSSALKNTLSLNISGVNVPTACLTTAFVASGCGSNTEASMSYRFTTFPINGTFCLTKDPNSCTWSVIVPVVVDVWFDTGEFGIAGCGGYGGVHKIYTQLKITAREVYAPGVGAQMAVTANVIDASKDWRALASGVSTWDGFDPFSLIIYSNFDVLDCLGTVTLHNTGLVGYPSHAPSWFNDYENLQFIVDDCNVEMLRNGWNNLNDPPPAPTGTPWSGVLVLADAAC